VGRVELDAGWRLMIDLDPNFVGSVCRTLDGEPITAPWFWDKSYKGHPSYLFCTNSPGFLDCVRHQVETALTADVDALMFDSQINTMSAISYMGGCFCQWCMEGFRAYLEEQVPSTTLAECGVTSLDRFDYGEFLRSRGIDPQRYRNQINAWTPELPLAQEYLDFQYRRVQALGEEFRRHVERMAGRHMPLSSSAPMTRPEKLFPASFVSFFTSEMHYEAATRQTPREIIFAYKMAEAFDLPILGTGLPQQDWATVNRENRPGLVRTWIAQAYAYGANFMIPDRMWCYGLEHEDVGTHWYTSKPEEYDFLYHFVRRHADLLDDYDAVTHVGLLYSNAAARRNPQPVKDVCITLCHDNVPCRLLLAGDDWLPERITTDHIEDVNVIIVPGEAHLDPGQQAVLDEVKDRIVEWPDTDRLCKLAPREIVVENASNVSVVPRAKRGDKHAPFVCHLLNRNYLPDEDAMDLQKDFSVSIADSLFEAAIGAATLYAPGREPVECEISALEGATQIIIAELDIWAILELAGNQQSTGNTE